MIRNEGMASAMLSFFIGQSRKDGLLDVRPRSRYTSPAEIKGKFSADTIF